MIKLLIFMHLALSSSIIFPANEGRKEFEIRYINSCEIEGSWQLLTDTATIVLPKNINIKDNSIKNLIRRGDPIEIYLGCNGDMYKEFEGKVVSVNLELPVEIKCEDYMYDLKRMPCNVSYRKVSLKTLLNDIVAGFKTEAIDIELGAFRAEKTTVAKVLELLKDDYSIYSYFKGKTLVSGKVYSDDTEVVNYDFNENVIGNDLKYVSAEDLKLKVTANSISPGGEKLSVTVGDDDGTESNLIYPGVSSEKELKALAKLDLDKMKKSGFEGTMKTFGKPYFRHGFKAKLSSSEYPEREGTYVGDKVVVRFNDAPEFRREITLGKQL